MPVVPSTPLRSFAEPSARPDRRRPLPVRPRHVRLDVRLDPSDPRVSGAVTHVVEALGDGVTTLPFDAADLKVTAAERDRVALEAIAHAAGVDVRLDRPLAAGEQVEITLRFEGRPTMGLFFIDPDGERPQAWTQGAMEDHHHWFPCFDAPEHPVTTEVIATVPEPCVALSNGEPALYGEVVEPGWRRFHWKHETPHALYLLTLVVDELVCVEDHRGPVPLYHYVPPGREADARALFERVPQMIEWLGEATGRPYPYPRYGHVFLRGFMWGGMENTTLTSLTDTALVEAGHLREEELERLVVHELAHQWFGDLIAPRGWPEIWLNESFATYFDLLGVQMLDGDDAFHNNLAAYRGDYLDEAKNRYVRPVVTRSYVHPYVLFDRHAYEKGALVLHTLRDQLGEDGFWRGLRLYVERAAGTAAETSDVRRAFEDATGADLHAFFEEMVYREGHVELRVEWSWRPAVGLELHLERTDDGPQCFDVTLAIHAGGETRRRRIPITPALRTVVVDCERAPLWVALDPEAHCLVELDERAERDEALHARLDPAHAPLPLRVRTATLLGERGHAGSAAALARALTDDPSWTVRAAAATALGNHRSDDARDALLGAVHDDAHWRVRAAAGKALAQGADGGWVKTIEGLLADEKSARVRAALLDGLGAIRDKGARAVLRRHLDQPSPRDRVAAAAVRALAAQEHPEVVDEILLRSETGHPKEVRRAAIDGLARLGKAAGVEERDRRRIREAIEARLSERDFHLRGNAIRALQALGDPAARPALERAHGAERFAIIQRAIREALGALDGEKGKGGKG
ncbi:MAG: M1 family aminopeptidase [bacterium]